MQGASEGPQSPCELLLFAHWLFPEESLVGPASACSVFRVLVAPKVGDHNPSQVP